jgi:hypothetical protein
MSFEKGATARCRQALPDKPKLKDAIVRLTVDIPAEWRDAIDQAALQAETLSPLELLQLYREASGMHPGEAAHPQALAAEIIQGVSDTERMRIVYSP